MFKALDKLFRKKKEKQLWEMDTLPLDVSKKEGGEDIVSQHLSSGSQTSPSQSGSRARLIIKPPQISASCAQSTGIQRDHNEDSLFSLTTLLSGSGEAIPLGIYIVADGMGGHHHGEIASKIAVKTMASHIVREILVHHISPSHLPPEESLQEIMSKGIHKAHETVLGEAIGGGTTLTAITIFNKQLTIAHVGDSRIYKINLDGHMEPVTRDHSLVKRLEELGQLTPEEAAVDPRRNVLYHALGQAVPLEPEIISLPCPSSGYLLLCSDGLWGVISEKMIGDIIRNNPILSDACQEMVDAANAVGGPDNISVILIKLPEY